MIEKLDDTSLICITPVRDEAWILDNFLQAASLWADHIVIVDHCSRDGSREIARKYEKVTLVEYDKPEFNEPARRRLLIETAREVAADKRRILLALDADEAFSGNFLVDGTILDLANEPEGTPLYFKWANILPDFTQAWTPPHYIQFGLVDDGTDFATYNIHGPRLPLSDGRKPRRIEDTRVLHFQYTEWQRMKSKQRWYQIWEWLNVENKRAVQLFRQYHQMDAIPHDQIQDIRSEWLDTYERYNINLRSFRKESVYRWDREVIDLLIEHGPERFRKLNIWDVDWEKIRGDRGRPTTSEVRLDDPRRKLDKKVHQWLGVTQRNHDRIHIRVLQKLLQLSGW